MKQEYVSPELKFIRVLPTDIILVSDADVDGGNMFNQNDSDNGEW